MGRGASFLEREVFSANDVQIRKADETRYGKGEMRITEGYVYLRYKKFLGKEQSIRINCEDIAKVEFRDRGLPIEIIGPGFSQAQQSWVTLEIILKDGGGYTLYVGQPPLVKPDKIEEFMGKFHTIHRILTQGTPSPSDKASQYCPSCGGENDLDAKFCTGCGAPLRPLEPRSMGAPPAPSPIKIQKELKCPRCGFVDEKDWVCPQCQEEGQPYYIDGEINYLCSKCGFDRQNIFPDPELICRNCTAYSRSSAWKPA